MLTDTVQPKPESDRNSETDLSALAEHLSIIADALRQSTSGSGSEPKKAQGAQGEPSFASHPTFLPRVPATDGGEPPVSRAQIPAAFDARLQRKAYGDMAREAYAVRRRRTTIFDNCELFGEPAWDILLDLYIAHVEDKPVSVSSACIGSAAPPTTGLRWLGVLAEQELILREHDPEDQRRVLVRLTEKGLSAMDQYFASLGLTP